MKGISYNVIECKLVKKQWGTFVAWWYDDFFRLRRFAFSRLQIELTHFGYRYRDGQYEFTPDMICLNVHIPRNGERMDDNLIEKSLEESIEFYRPLFKNKPIVFKCESWLLFHSTLELSDKDSNIYKFSKRFKIFKEKEDNSISEMWRLFDEEITDLNKLKADTTLRRRYLEYLKKGGKIGEGVGFFVR